MYSRLKITDLEPIDFTPLEVQCVFSVVLYRLPKEKISSVPDALSMLDTKGLELRDPEGFAANFLWAGLGRETLGPAVVRALNELGAERTGIKRLILFQNYPEEIAGFPVERGQSIFYYREDGMTAGRRIPAGRLSLVLRAQPDTPRRGFARIEIEPLFRQVGFMNLPESTRRSLLQSILFEEGRLQATMAKGDFLVLMTTKTEHSSFFRRFFSNGDTKNPSAMLYFILCQQTGEQ